MCGEANRFSHKNSITDTRESPGVHIHCRREVERTRRFPLWVDNN